MWLFPENVEDRNVLGYSMSSNDGTTPPVLFVVGTAGAGKSSLVTSFQRWARFLDIDVLAVNLDPGAERVHYDPEFDVRDLISLSDVMSEYDLGPNGAQILAADLVAAQAEDVFDNNVRGCPPNLFTPTSNETLVLVDGFS